MSLNQTPSANRIHIGIFGRRNAGKSSLLNALTSQSLSIVSPVKGTTTDPVQKTMELLPLGPVVLIDTPGLDDVGELGEKRVQKAFQALNKTDLVLLVADYSEGLSACEYDLLEAVRKKQLPCILVWNKWDLATVSSGENVCSSQKPAASGNLPAAAQNLPAAASENLPSICVSASLGWHIRELKELIGKTFPQKQQAPLIRDLVRPSDLVVLVIPIDTSAPKGRLILPQQQVIRDLLDGGAVSVVASDAELPQVLASFQKDPALVVCDSQVFHKVSPAVPLSVPLTSFSILFARYKGCLPSLAKGASFLDDLEDGSHILICEGCTHHRQCEDIGTVKLPAWIRQHTNKEFQFSFTSGTEFPADLNSYDFIIHCGSCMLPDREFQHRVRCAKDAGIPITNYGTVIAHMRGILERSLEPFQHLL
ncbi:[FeFe] hydrogenase H-cluster maturation GTPase HydF [Clostridiaceae bacterium 68-1-5]|uniref:[FeFe] hydrogenase H-cluster maturation GTPase HydF n=1 Tax=Suipraeoptans intestinalis TaxID=2606628 RepID=A0A6N7V268_9FIRM|nr:[FeFe] hydrogenase H-cluster maturation GTPase HydF [Suipraeoptans intestinalis]MSR94240.1 [FeFe] hydrogenase H-cluster maturation GTPase HydF [Suipraeoptans intestinalis]